MSFASLYKTQMDKLRSQGTRIENELNMEQFLRS